MYNSKREVQFEKYNLAKDFFIKNPQKLIALEKMILDTILDTLNHDIEEIKNDYNEASYLYSFWQNYPPDDRGRSPKGDQYPWIEVGEHVFGPKFSRNLGKYFKVRDCGIPTGSDERFVLSSKTIHEICEITDSCWLFLDIKSVGPRDDQDHAVMSHNQISGDGLWVSCETGVTNTILVAQGSQASHDFHCAIPPIYVLSDGTILPVVTIVIKPVYTMLNSTTSRTEGGQPLKRVDIATIPNGILLCVNPNYLKQYPGLLFPGKDDKAKNPKKLRARVSFEKLRAIDNWRVQTIQIDIPKDALNETAIIQKEPPHLNRDLFEF